MGNLTESAKLRNAIKKIVKQVIDEEEKPCFRLYKAQVISAPSGTTYTVQLDGYSNTMTLPYSSAVYGVNVGDMVWVATLYNSFSNAIVYAPIDFSRYSSWTTLINVLPPDLESGNLKTGKIRYCKIGKFVYVNFEELRFNKLDYSGGQISNNILIENLPKGNSNAFIINPFANPSAGSVRLNIINGTCYGWYTTVADSNTAFYGNICYIEGA